MDDNKKIAGLGQVFLKYNLHDTKVNRHSIKYSANNSMCIRPYNSSCNNSVKQTIFFICQDVGKAAPLFLLITIF